MNKMMLCITAVSLFSGALSQAQPRESVPEELAEASPYWLGGWQEEVDEQFRLLTSAYEFDEDVKVELRRELERRLVEQYSYDQAVDSELEALGKRVQAAGAEEGTPEANAFWAELQGIHDGMPLNPNRVANWVDGQLSSEAAAQGRQRLEELWVRRDQMRSVRDQDLRRRAGMKATIIRGRKVRKARISPEGRPMPHGSKADPVLEQARREDAKRIMRPNQGTSERSERPSPEAGQPPRPVAATAARPAVAFVPYPIAPPLDEWDRYVASVAEKYGFADAQVTKARSILRDMRRRAYQYQMSRSDDFARAKLLADGKAREARLEELNLPLGALFFELKQRLEALPTTEQRQRAGPAKEKQG